MKHLSKYGFILGVTIVGVAPSKVSACVEFCTPGPPRECTKCIPRALKIESMTIMPDAAERTRIYTSKENVDMINRGDEGKEKNK
jgi:hypothetical protein